MDNEALGGAGLSERALSVRRRKGSAKAGPAERECLQVNSHYQLSIIHCQFKKQRSSESMKKVRVITAEEAALMVKDGDTVSTGGFVSCACPEALTKALEQRYVETGHPRDRKSVV